MAPAQTEFLNFGAPGQLTNNFGLWNDNGTGTNAGQYGFEQNTNGAVTVFQSTDTTATYMSGSWNLATNRATALVSVFVQANGQSSGNTVQLGFINSSSNGFYSYPGVAFESYRFIPVSATNWTFYEQHRSGGVTSESDALRTVSIVPGHWYKFLVALTNYEGVTSGVFAGCSLFDEGTNGAPAGADKIVFTSYQYHPGLSVATNEAIWPALRAFEDGGISAWDDFMVYTAGSAPVVTQPLTNLLALTNSPVILTTLAEGPGAISYVWRTNGALLTGASPTRHSIARMPPGLTLVTVVAKNSNGSATNEATLTGIIPMTPIAVTGFNRDVVIEASAAGPPYGNSAAEFAPSFGTCYYEQGLPGTSYGLPASGVFSSVADLTQFQFQSYTANNAMVLSSETGASYGTLTLVTPAAFSRIAILANSAGASPASTGSLTLRFADGSTLVTNYDAADWLGNPGFALQGVDQIALSNGAAQGGPRDPRFYETTINLAGLNAANKTLSSLTFGPAPGAAATAIYAVSGLVNTKNPFVLATVSNSPASDIGWTAATVGGNVAATGGYVPQITLYYGPADGGGKAAAWANSVPLGYQGGAFSQTLPGLLSGSTIYYTVQASNIAGTSWAAPSLSFTTIATAPPVVANLPAADITAQSATLAANVLNTGGLAPAVTIFYGPADETTNAAKWASSLNIGAETGYAAISVGALSSNTSYYFTARASNDQGVAWAAPSQSFTTLAANPASTLRTMLTFHNNNARDGVNTNETQLTPANVNTNTFGKMFSCSVDGYVYAQPLVMTNVIIPGRGSHNVVYVATEHDSVYAFDADDNQGDNANPLWQTSFLDAGKGVTTVPAIDVGTQDIAPEIGITATPVIDPATGTLYVEVKTKEPDPVYVHRLHALDITTGAERVSGAVSNSPAIIAATNYPGTGSGEGDSDGQGHVLWNGLRQHCRPALTLLNGVIYVAYASHGDNDPYHGWLFGYSAQSLAQVSVYNTTPNGSRGGIWQGGGGATVDEAGNFYFVTGNGSTSNDFNATGATFSQATNNFAMSVLKFAPANGAPQVVDFFAPFNQAALTALDWDLGSGAALVLPDSAGSVAHPHLLVAGGKSGTMYLLDRDNLGHFNASGDSQIVQVMPNALGIGSFSTPAFFNQTIYYAPFSSPLLAFSLNDGTISTNPPVSGLTAFGFGGCGSPSISANGSSNAIVWVMDSDAWASGGPGVLRAYNATNVAQELYNSSMVLSRDNPGGAVKFCTPTVINGKVYVGTEYALSVFGLDAFLPVPVIQPNGGSFTNSLTVGFSDPAAGTSLYYTLDGSAPSTNSTLYTAPFVLTRSALLQVIASSRGAISGTASASFVDTAAPGGGQGLLGEYYSARLAAFTPPATLVRTDAVIDFNWKNAAPSRAVNRTEFSARWTGCVQAQYTETYTFTTWTDAGARLWINGQLLINAWTNQPPTSHSASIPMVAQQFYNIEMDYYYHNQGGPVAQLSWSSPTTPAQIIPPTQLYTVSNPPPSVVITSPTNGQSLPAGVSFTFSADAATPFNDIAQVSFYCDGKLVGTATGVPYALSDPGLPAGGHTLTAAAVDATGLSAVSAPVNITVEPVIEIVLTQPFPGGNRQMLLRGLAAYNYVLQTSSNLTQWTSISTNPVSGASVLLADPGSNGAPSRFYRLQSQP